MKSRWLKTYLKYTWSKVAKNMKRVGRKEISSSIENHWFKNS